MITWLLAIRPPISGKLLQVYIASSTMAIRALLVLEDKEGSQQPIYNVSKPLNGAETRYLEAEKLLGFDLPLAVTTSLFPDSQAPPYGKIRPFKISANMAGAFWTTCKMATPTFRI